MNKKKVFFTLILSFLLIYSSIGFAENLSINDSNEELKLSKSFDNVKVYNLTNNEIHDLIIESILLRAKGVAKEEKYSNSDIAKINGFSQEEIVVNYMINDGEYLYFYEEDAENNSTLFILESKDNQDNLIEQYNSNYETMNSINNLPGGIGGRAIINSTNGNYLESKWKLATTSQISGTPEGAGYIYVGLNGSNVEVNANLSYSTTLNGSPAIPRWRPRLVVAKNGKHEGVFHADYREVQYANGYKPGTEVTSGFWKSYTDTSRGINNAVRLKHQGTAVCTDRTCATKKDTFLVSILEVNNQNITSIDYFKLLVTIAGTDSVKGNNYGEFKNITLDGVSKTPIKDTEDNAKVTINGNNVTIVVKQ